MMDVVNFEISMLEAVNYFYFKQFSLFYFDIIHCKLTSEYFKLSEFEKFEDDYFFILNFAWIALTGVHI